MGEVSLLKDNDFWIAVFYSGVIARSIHPVGDSLIHSARSLQQIRVGAVVGLDGILQQVQRGRILAATS
jgi:hypothetical protein